MKKFNPYLAIILLAFFSACVPDSVELEDPGTDQVVETAIEELENLIIPNSFDFETERNVTISINDATPHVKYEVFAYAENYASEEENINDALNHLIYSGKPYDGLINHDISLSTTFNKLYLKRKDGLEYTHEIVDVLNDRIDFVVVTNKSATKNVKKYNDSCSECTENFFLNGDFEEGPTLPSSYIITNENNVEGWSTTATDNKIELWKSGFNGVKAQNGTYFAELNANLSSALYQRICTSPGAEITWSVWHRGRAGTDTAVVRIGENLSTATVEATMTTGNIEWVQYSGTYTVPENQEDTYFIFEAVSTASSISVGNFIDNIVITETKAGDCSSASNKLYYPNELTNATITFEDLWPYSGDYDFNDLVISYNIKTVLNSENKVIQLDYNYMVESIGASYTNGYGIELEGVLPAAISSVSGANLTEGIISNNDNGTEKLQPNAVIVFFDNSHINVGLSNTISITFAEPITTAALGNAPFNPFLIINKDRQKEVHLPNKPTTYYPKTTTIEVGPTVKDSDGDFKTPQGFPWAMNINGEYKAPKESVIITDAYNYFADWATSGGNSKTDWFQDKSGYRNNSNLKN